MLNWAIMELKFCKVALVIYKRDIIICNDIEQVQNNPISKTS